MPSGCSATLIVTAVCEPLCGIPIITAVISRLQNAVGEGESWRACLIPDACWRSFLFETRHGENRQAGTSIQSQTQ